MAITKTKFIQYIRCPRFVALDNVKKEKLGSMITFEEYHQEEEEEMLRELLGSMYDGGVDLIDQPNDHLNVMMPYYNQVEQLAGKIAPNYFEGTFTYSKDTFAQESFDCKKNGILYLCYVDIFNDQTDHFNIIEAKATSTSKYLSLGVGRKDELGHRHVDSIFQKKEDGIYYLLEECQIDIETVMTSKQYMANRDKLKDMYHGAGHYVYDLAVQRYIIENDLKASHRAEMIPKVHYYLAVLNHEYEFDGTYIGETPDYHKDQNGNDIICYLDMTTITGEMLETIDQDRQVVQARIQNLCADPCKIGPYCEYKKTTKCKYASICWDFVPKKNSVMNYIDQHHGFKNEKGDKVETFEFLNQGIVKMEDVPIEYLNRKKNQIQREVVVGSRPYQDIDKLRDGIRQIRYPIYHLDFETFPCPLPRYRGEHCYTQSVFQFSLHIERAPGVCDKNKDHYEYLAVDHKDRREELVKRMCEWIDTESGGCVLVYNEAFEKSRLKELAIIFPEYREKLLKIRNMIFDLMFIIKSNTTMYQALGYDKDRSSMFNYYHKDMTGSFSIKKILPLFSNLTYQGMEVANGIEALVAYATFPKLLPKEYHHKYQKLVEYCKQDTWAMVEILQGLSKSVN